MSKKTIALISALVIVANIFTGCDNKVESSSQEIDNTLNGEISISTYFENQYLMEAAKAFEKKYPNVKITIDAYKKFSDEVEVAEGQVKPGADLESERTPENYVTQLNTKFMAGEAEDMLLLSWLPINKYVDSGYLLDLTDRMSADQELIDEGYYTQVIKGNTYNNIIYSIPMSFDFTMFGVNGDVFTKSGLEDSMMQSDGWSYSQMKDVMSKVSNKEQNEIYFQTGSANNLFSTIFKMRSNEFIDLESKTLKVDSKEFIELLDECKQVEEDGLLYEGEEEDKYSLFAGPMGGKYILFQKQYIGAGSPMYYAKPLVNESGEISLNVSEQMAITKDAKNQDLCWKFIKFMLSEEMQKSPELDGTYAINKKVAAIKMQNVIKEFIKEVKEEKVEVILSEDEILKDLSKNIDHWVSMPYMKLYTTEISDVVEEGVTPFFEGKQSAQEVAKALQSKLYTRLNE